MFKLARRDALVDVDARTDITGNAAGHHHQPEKRSACRSHKRQKQEDCKREADRQSRAGNEKERDTARIVNTGLHKPSAQHFHVLVVCRPVMLRCVFDQPANCFLAGMLQRAGMIGLALFVSQDARSAPLD